jgi:hypothetical protein
MILQGHDWGLSEANVAPWSGMSGFGWWAARPEWAEGMQPTRGAMACIPGGYAFQVYFWLPVDHNYNRSWFFIELH